MPGLLPTVLFVLNRLSVGGMEKRVTRIAAVLKAAGWPIGVLCLSESGPLEAMLRESGIRLDVLDYKGIRQSGPLGAWRSIRAARAIVCEFQPDVIQSFLPVGNMFTNLISSASPRAKFVAGKVTTGLFYRRGYFYGVFENWTLQRAKRVYCNGEIIKRELAEKCGVKESNIRVIHNGIDFPPPPAPEDRARARAVWRERLTLPGDAVLLGMVANLYAYKGHRHVVEAAADIVKRHPKVHFVFAGRDEGEREPLNRLAEELGVRERIHMPGAIDDVRTLLLSLDVFLSASLVEGFSNVWLEGMAAQLPCVFTRVGAAGEAFRDGHDCLLATPGETPALRNALLCVLEDRDLAAHLAAQGYTAVAERFSFDAMVEGFKAMYLELLAEKS